MKKVQDFIKTITILITLFTISANSISQIPDRIFYKADSILLSNLGEEFFKKSELNCIESYLSSYYTDFSFCDKDTIISDRDKKHIELVRNLPGSKQYRIIYNLFLDSKYTYPIQMTFDTLGNFKRYETSTIPNCIRRNNCLINIDSTAALQIAKENNFPKGIKNFKIKLECHHHWGYFYWHISNTLKYTETESEGQFCIVKAYNGEYEFSQVYKWKSKNYTYKKNID